MQDRSLQPSFSHPGLISTPRGPLVLLFFDGYDLSARPGLCGMTYSQGRRFLRYAKRTLYREQVRTGFYTAFLALVSGLRRVGCNVQVNNFRLAMRYPHYPIGVAGYPSIIDRVELPNPRIFGPGDFGLPDASAAVAANPYFKKLILASDWFRDVYRPYCGDKTVTWFAGIDTGKQPDFSREAKDYDFVVYDKIRWHREELVPSFLSRITGYLKQREHSYTVLRYGHHHHRQFLNTLRRAKSMIFVCEHETQGLAYQEAMSANIPILAWDEGKIVDPILQPYVSAGIQVSSVPYFSRECGMRFKSSDFERVCEDFWLNLPSFTPRRYVENNLSLELSASRYLREYAELG